MFVLENKDLEDRILKALPAKNKDDLFLKMYFGDDVGTIKKDDVLHFHHFYLANDFEVRKLLINLHNKGVINDFLSGGISIKKKDNERV